MNPTQTGRLVSPHPVLPSAGEHLRPETPQVGTSVHPSTAAISTSEQIGNLTFHVGRVVTALSDSEAELLRSALCSETPEDSLGRSPDTDGVYSYVIGAKDNFASVHLLRQYPERMTVSCTLDPSLGLKDVVISELMRDLKIGQIYFQAHFEPPQMATQASASEQATSSMGALPSSRTNLSVYPNSALQTELIKRQNPHDEELNQFSVASTGVPGPSRTRAVHTARHSPYPVPSVCSVTSGQSANTSSQALNTADRNKIQKAAGNATLNYVIQHLDGLQNALGSREQVIKIAAHHGGQHAVQALLDKGPALRQAGFSPDKLVSISGKKAGKRH